MVYFILNTFLGHFMPKWFNGHIACTLFSKSLPTAQICNLKWRARSLAGLIKIF